MIAESPKPLPENISMSCYACDNRSATHLCRYKIGEMAVQVCLCQECMQIDTQRLLEHTIGIQEEVDLPAEDQLVFNEVRFSVGRQTV